MDTYKSEETYIKGPFGNIRWEAILGGWVVATAVALVFYALGAAIGINVIQGTNLEAMSLKTVVLSSIWLLVSWVVALYLGGLFSSRGVKKVNHGTGTLHAIGVWAVSNVMTILVAVSGVGMIGLTGTLALSSGFMAAAPVAAEAVEQNPNVPSNFLAQLKYGISDSISKRTDANADNINQSLEELNAKNLTLIGADFLRGDKTAAQNSLAIYTSLSNEEAAQVVDSLSAETEEVKARVKEAADKAAAYTSAALWASVLISLLSLQAAIMGGRTGAREYCRKVEYAEPPYESVA